MKDSNPTVNDSSGSASIPRTFMSVIRRSWWVVACLSLFGALFALGVSFMQTPEYRAVAVLYVTSGNDGNTQSAYQGSLASQERVVSYAKLADSDAVVSAALRSSGLPLSTESAKSEIVATGTTGTAMFSISSTGPDPSNRIALVNAVSEAMVSYVSELERPAGGGEPLAKVTIVSPASVGAGPVTPKFEQNVAMGLACGFLIGIVVLAVRTLIDDRIRTRDDVAKFVSEPVLGEIPEDPGLGADPVGYAQKSGTIAAESLRMLRSNLGFARVDQSLKSLIVSSANSGDGKTTTVLALAAVFAEAGKRVIVVDCDLRVPSVADRLGLIGDVGFTDFVKGVAPVRELIQSDMKSGFDVICSGTIPPNPAELVGSESAGRLISELEREYDYVLVDVPPVLAVADACELGQYVSGALFVAKSGVTTGRALSEALAVLSSAHVGSLGIVLNGAVTTGSRYEYYGERKIDEETSIG